MSETCKSNEFGLSVIPVKDDKTPFKEWRNYQNTMAPIDSWLEHYKNNRTVGIICGKISGNLEIIDIDIKNDPSGKIAKEYSALIPEELKSRLIIQTTPNKGYHLIYRCQEVSIEKSQKLAHHSDGAVIIETRGEGGYFCTSKVNNKVKRGKFDIENLEVDIPIITKKERELLLESARSLNRHFQALEKNEDSSKFVYKEPAIIEFNDNYDIIELFEKHGWQVVNEDSEKKYLLRPGSTTSFHSGYYFTESKVFYCFSTSTSFTSEKPYNHFQVLQVLEDIKDYRAALRCLKNLGYSSQISDKKEKITADDIADYLNNNGVRYDTFIQDLTLNGEIINELDYNTLFIDLKKDFEREIPRSRYEEVIKSNYISQRNPVLEFIENNKEYSTTGNFEMWFENIVLKNKEIQRKDALYFIKKWYVGMIAQALDGEYPNEFFLAILSTEQGIGKSTLLRNSILPKELRDYQVEHSLTFDDDFKVIMGQSLLVIDDEMDGRTYDSAQTFKNVLSQKKMTTRRKYDRRISTIKRRCSFAGSGNNLNIVRESQNRRVIPVEIESINWEGLDKVDYKAMFMEAHNLFIQGFKYSYQACDKEKLNALYVDYVQKMDVELILDELVELPDNESEEEFMSTIKIVELLIVKYPQFVRRINPITVGKIMNDRGFRSTRQGDQRISGYFISCRSLIKLKDPDADFGTLLGFKSSKNLDNSNKVLNN